MQVMKWLRRNSTSRTAFAHLTDAKHAFRTMFMRDLTDLTDPILSILEGVVTSGLVSQTHSRTSNILLSSSVLTSRMSLLHDVQ